MWVNNLAHFFLLTNPDEYHTLTEPNLISYALIKLTKTGGMYTKGIENWQNGPPQDRGKWAKLLTHVVEDYEQQFTKMGGTTIGQESYETTIHTTEELTDGDFLT